MNIIIRDESITGKSVNEFCVDVVDVNVALKEIIRLRIYQEVEAYNLRKPDYFQGLVQPTDAERLLNGYKLKEKRFIDPEKQYYLALNAFQKNSFFVIVNNQQIMDLEEKVSLNVHTIVSFIKLTPLVGG